MDFDSAKQAAQDIRSTFTRLPHTYGGAWGGFAFGAGALALVSPYVLKSDDRGYMRTAMLTTPLIAAGLAVGPGVWGGFKSAYKRTSEAAAANPLNINSFDSVKDIVNKNPNYKTQADLQMLLDKGSISKETYSKMLPIVKAAERRDQATIFSQFVTGRRTGNLKDLQQAVGGLLDKRIEKLQTEPARMDRFLQDMSYALYESKVGAGLASNRAANAPAYPSGPVSLETLQSEIQDFGKLPESEAVSAMRTMRRRLVLSARQTAGAVVSSASHVSNTSALPRNLEIADQASTGLLKQAVGEGFGAQMLSNLERAQKSGYIDRMELMMRKDQAIGLRLYRGGERDPLTLGLVNPETGRVWGGKDLQLEGAARFVRRNGADYARLDLHMTEHLSHPFSELREELDSHFLYTGTDIDDEWSKANQLDRATSVMPDSVAKMRSQEVAASKLPIFNGKRFKDLTYEERLKQEEQFQTIGGYFGNDSGVASGTGVLWSEAEKTPGMVPTQNKADDVGRSLKKNRRVDVGTVPESLRPFYSNQAVEAVEGVGRTPAFGMTLGQVTPQQVDLFGHLPDTVLGLHRPDVASYSISRLREDIAAFHPNLGEEGLDRLSNKAWTSLRTRFENNPLHLHAARKLGRVGEGDFLVNNEFSKMVMSEGAIARVKHLTIDPETIEQGFSGSRVIGYDEAGAAITSPAPNNILKSATQEGADGSWIVHYDRLYPTETGSKLDALAYKGLMIKTKKGELSSILDTLNLTYKTTGRGTPFSRNVQALVAANYFSTKESSVLASYGMAHDVLNRLDTAGGRLMAADFRDKYAELGVRMGPKGIYESTLDELAYMQKSGRDVRALKAQRLADIEELTRDLMRSTEKFLYENPASAKADPVFRNYASMRELRNDYGLSQHLEHFSLPVGQAFMWDSMRADVPGQVSMTYDMYTQMLRNGETSTVRELLQESQGLHGDTKGAWQFLEHLYSKDAFQKPLGEVVELKDKMDFSSLFDAEGGKYRDNFSLDLGKNYDFKIGDRTVSGRYMPVRGLDTYRAASNEFGAGESAMTKMQSSLIRVAEASLEGRVTRVANTSRDYLNVAVDELLGKGGLLSPKEFHPNAMSLGIQTMPSRSEVAAGKFNPFDVTITRDQLHRLQDTDLRTALENGEEVFAKAARHPISAMPFVRVRLAQDRAGLGPNMIGIDEGLRSILNSDDDKDMLNLIFLRDKASRDEAKEAIAYSANPAERSAQWKNHRMIELMQGNAEDSARSMGRTFGEEFFAGSVEENLTKLRKQAQEGTFKNAIRRLVAGETGTYSNLLTRLHMNLEMHPTMAASEDRGFLGNLFFQVRQVPISGSKGKANLAGDPKRLWTQFTKGLSDVDEERGMNRAHDAMTEILLSGKTTRLSEADLIDARDTFGITHRHFDAENRVLLSEPQALRAGDLVNLGAETMHAGRGRRVFEEFYKGRNRGIDKAVGAFTRETVDLAAGEGFVRAIQEGKAGALAASRTGQAGRMADASTEALRAGVNTLTEAAGDIAHGFKPAMPILAAGLGIAALAGFLGTNISGSKRRPEETAGSADAPPAQPVEGSESNRPRVQVMPAPAQTKTALVRPMQKNNDVEVRAAAPDRAAAAETSRIVEKLSNRGGNSTTTINYRGGPRERMSRLRLKQELREELDRTA